ncbi:MAG: universal stress protein, partial [Actinomycetota bacterium]|nr:universal stress protein [Actinomycetota bacterium]
MSHVLAAIDTSPSAQAVLETAISIAELFETTVEALHVREDGSDPARAIADAAGIKVREISGSPIAEIVTAAEDPRVIAVVLGARGARPSALPAGHVALEVITRVYKPVVVVPPTATAHRRIAQVLIPLEGTEESSQAISDLVELAGRLDAEVLVLHIHAPDAVPAFEDQPQYAIPAWNSEFIARFVTPESHVKVISHVGEPTDHIVAVAVNVQADLIALAWNQNLAPGRATVVRETLAQSPIPVILLPTTVTRE